MRRITLSAGRSVTVTPARYLACEIGPDSDPPGGSRQNASVDVLVTGGTGRLGQRLLGPLQEAGHSVRQMSRRGTGPGGVRGDLVTGLDLSSALAGAELVVHAASDPQGDPWQVDVAGTRRLVEAVDRGRLQHLVYISIVGVDRVPYGYYRAKFAAEQILLASGLPVTLLRVTQFHDFVDFLLDTARRGPVLPVPMGWRVQPVDVGEVAEHVTQVCAGPPAGGVVEFGGPEDLSAADLARSWAAVRAPGAHVVATPVPGKLSTAFRDGAALPSSGARGRRTYAQHLAG
jgi:uncharacterized protein YbjT (DUF2867 family)